jgi:hypothetical protein
MVSANQKDYHLSWPWIFISLILEILLNFIVFGLLLYVLVLMWLKKKMMTMFHFWTGFLFCTDYDNDFKAVCITFCKLYPSFREPTEFLLVWSFLYGLLSSVQLHSYLVS